MKNIIFIIFLGFSQLLISQNQYQNVSTIPLGCNLIVYHNDSLNSLQLLDSWVNLLKMKGYTFANIDKEYFILETNMNKIREQYNVKISLVIDGSKVLIRTYGAGTTKLSMAGFGGGMGIGISEKDDNSFRGINKGAKSNYANVAFQTGVSLIEAFNKKYGGSFYYSTEK